MQVDLQDAMYAWIDGTPIPELAHQWFPETLAGWALEQTVTNICETFKRYLALCSQWPDNFPELVTEWVSEIPKTWAVYRGQKSGGSASAT